MAFFCLLSKLWLTTDIKLWFNEPTRETMECRKLERMPLVATSTPEFKTITEHSKVCLGVKAVASSPIF